MGEMEHMELSPPHCLALETYFEDVKGVARITVPWALHQDIIIKKKGDESAWPMASGRASREV